MKPFRRHVGHRAHDAALDREVRATRRREIENRPRARRTPRREAEVEHLGAGLREHHVRGLQIPVNDSLAMRGIQRVGNLDQAADRFSRAHRPPRQTRLQRLAVDELHDEVIQALVSAYVEE